MAHVVAVGHEAEETHAQRLVVAHELGKTHAALVNAEDDCGTGVERVDRNVVNRLHQHTHRPKEQHADERSQRYLASAYVHILEIVELQYHEVAQIREHAAHKRGITHTLQVDERGVAQNAVVCMEHLEAYSVEYGKNSTH